MNLNFIHQSPSLSIRSFKHDTERAVRYSPSNYNTAQTSITHHLQVLYRTSKYDTVL